MLRVKKLLDPARGIMIGRQKSGDISEERTGKSVRGEDGETSVHSTAAALMNTPPKSDTSVDPSMLYG